MLKPISIRVLLVACLGLWMGLYPGTLWAKKKIRKVMIDAGHGGSGRHGGRRSHGLGGQRGAGVREVFPDFNRFRVAAQGCFVFDDRDDFHCSLRGPHLVRLRQPRGVPREDALERAE